MPNYFFTADEHYDHTNINRYCGRPFRSVTEMNEHLIAQHNAKVTADDITFHVGDFYLGRAEGVLKIISRLNGTHWFIPGSHDKWLERKTLLTQGLAITKPLLELKMFDPHIICCHYAMRVWAKSHFNSWHVYGHSHGKLPPEGKSWDVGVDNNAFAPVSYEELVEIMKNRPDNFNLVKERRY